MMQEEAENEGKTPVNGFVIIKNSNTMVLLIKIFFLPKKLLLKSAKMFVKTKRSSKDHLRSHNLST